MSFVNGVGVRVECVGLVCASTALCLVASASADIARVSVAADGTQANGASGPSAAISGDGRYVVFASAATNLVPNDTNGSVDVFLKDRQTGAIQRISLDNTGAEKVGDSGVLGVDISADGNVVVFTSKAVLSPEDTVTCSEPTNAGTGPSCTDIYVWHRNQNPPVGTVTRLFIAAGGWPNGPSREPTLDAIGSKLAFTSDASNLVPGDTNGVSDVFQTSLVTPFASTRDSVSTTGAEGNAASFGPAISADGQVVAFVSHATNLTGAADPAECMTPTGPSPSPPCGRAFVRTHEPVTPTPTTTGLPRLFELGLSNTVVATLQDVAITADGRQIAASFGYVPGSTFDYTKTVLLYDRVSGRSVTRTAGVPAGGRGIGVGVSADGRCIVGSGGFIRPATIPSSDGTVFDRLTGISETIEGSTGMADVHDLSSNGHVVLFSNVSGGLIAGDTNNARDVFVLDRDSDDHDGIVDSWEAVYALDPDNPADASLDPDGDGLTNLQEYQQNGHPNGTFTRYFAEGAQNAFFQTRFALFAPEASTGARVLLRYLGSDGTQGGQFAIVGDAHRSVDPAFLAPENFSTVVESNQPVVVDRYMRWGSGLGAGAHLETAITAPATTWYLAEGATHGAFDLFYLLQNATDADALVTIDYLRPAPLSPVTKIYAVTARSRRTIWVDAEGPELEATDVSAKITSSQPVIVERAMYFSRPGQPFLAGHDGAGITAPATKWFLAEGATGSFFDLYVLVANPGDTAAMLGVTYLLPTGAPLTKQYVVDARSRLTISVEGEDARLADTAVSVIVESTNTQPVIVERAMWWPGPDWHESHLSAGTTTTGTKWAIADGLTGTAVDGSITDTYVLIANTSDQAGTATVRVRPDSAIVFEPVVIALPANSRVNVPIGDVFPQLRESRSPFGVVVESSGPAIVVERARYTTAGGVVWTEGAAALATRLQ